MFLVGSIWCAYTTSLTGLLIGRAIQAAGACSTSVLSRAIARDLFSGTALGRAMALIMIAMAAAPGFSPLLGGALDHLWGWRSEFIFVALFAAVLAIAYAAILGETHHLVRIPLDPVSIGRSYGELLRDRSFVVPAATVSLIMGGLFSVFSAMPRILIETMDFSPIQLGLVFAGTVLIVFAAGMLATRLAPRLGLEQSIRLSLLAAAVGSVAILAISIIRPTFQPFVSALCIFLFGMGIVNPLGTALALSPFGKTAGAASALLGFWQMIGAATGVFLAAIILHDALLSLGIVLTVASLLAICLYAWRAKPT
jgi:DHA1 family bicyclomycin/chloramphenicol resistance-like MFS transporter